VKEREEAASPKTPPARLAALAARGGELARLVAKNPAAPAALSEELAASEDPGLRQAVAENPAAPPELLARLSGDRYPAIARAVAKNPNAPPKTLLDLARRYPGEVLANPALPLLFLERPGFQRDFPAEPLAAVLASRAAPEFLLLAAAARPEVPLRSLAARHPSTPAAALARLAVDDDAQVRASVALRPNTPRELRPLISLLARVAQRPPAPLTDEEIARLLECGEGGRMLLARHPQAPTPLLLELVARESRPAPDPLLTRASLPGEVLAAMARSPDLGLRCRAAAHHETPPEALIALAGEDLLTLRFTLLANPATPPEALSRLARVPLERPEAWTGAHTPALRAVGAHPRAPAGMLAALARSPSPELRRVAAASPRTPADALAALVSDKDAKVRGAARRNPAAPAPARPPRKKKPRR
jgi:hypothetical protein